MAKKTPPEITLPVSLVQQIVNYLQERPHREVRRLIDGVLQHNPPEEQDDD